MTNQTCTVCSSQMAPWVKQPLDPKKNERSKFENFIRCPGCGYGAMENLPNPEEISGFYNLEAYYTHGESHIQSVDKTIADRVLEKLAYWSDRQTIMSARDFQDRLDAGVKTLDVGCGSGALVREFRDAGFDAFGVDPDASAMSFRKENIFQGTAEALPSSITDTRYDLISIMHALEHCIDPYKALENIFNSLKPGGVLWCEVPNAQCAHFEDINICSENFDAPRHIHFFGQDALNGLCEKVGFEVERNYFSGFTRHHLPEWRAWERTICENTKKLDPTLSPPDHTFFKSTTMLAKTMFASPSKKYDCLGVIAVKPEN